METIELKTSSNPNASVIWMHGLGADGNDFVPLVPELNLGSLGIRFIFPHAPIRPVTINGGMRMRAWYDILSFDRSRGEDEAGLRASQALVEELIAAERARGIAAERIVLAGFSQGCAMTLMTGLRHPERLAGLLCLSGYLPLADKTASERAGANQNTPLFMAHGLDDPVITIDRARASRDVLKELGYPVEWHEYRMPHSVALDEIRDISHWLTTVLKPAA